MDVEPAAGAARAALAGAAVRARGFEDDVLSVVAVLGDVGAQRRLDDWLDSVAGALGALATTAEALGAGLPLPEGSRSRVRP